MRASSLANNPLAVTRELDGRYDVVLEVSEHLDEIAEILAMDLDTLLAELQEAADFSGLTVVPGVIAGWDSVNKILTVPTVEGARGARGERGERGFDGKTPLYGFTYNSATGNLEYTLTGYASINDEVEEW